MAAAGEVLKNLGRGGAAYSSGRHNIARHLMDEPEILAGVLNPFLEKAVFKLRKKEWIALYFKNKDWKTLEEIRRRQSSALDDAYLSLLTTYVITNAERVLSMYGRQALISNAVIEEDVVRIKDEIESLDSDDKQSLFTFRTVSALYAQQSEILKTYFEKNFKTDWLQKRFLYPLVYHAINSPQDTYLDSFLSYVVTGEEAAVERATIRFLLRDDICFDESLSFKAYNALLCHPYDASEILLNHIEIEFTKSGQISPALADALQRMAVAVPAPRLIAMSRLMNGRVLEFREAQNCPALANCYGFSADALALVENFTRTTPKRLPLYHTLGRPLTALARMRETKYPVPVDFDLVFTLGQKWRFSDAGRLLNALLCSIYMVPRRNGMYEVREFLRLTMFMGQLCPFIVASPSGTLALTRLLPGPAERQRIEDLCNDHISSSVEYSDRMWIKAVHWNLRGYVRDMRMKDWLGAVRRAIRVAPRFLTGIDWGWVDGIIKKVRVKPFAGNTDGVYALLLKQIEERDQDPTLLRTAIEPFVQKQDMEHFVEWLIKEYDNEAIAFVRYFLTPEIIMLLGLAPNETAALAGRVFALASCVQNFGFGEILSLELYEQESKALTNSFFLKNVNAGQFEIPWTIFGRDIAAKQKDLHDTLVALSVPGAINPLLSTARLSTPHRYRNGRVVKYTLLTSTWPLASLVIAIIEDFLQHPSFGLEVLLSTRFRHDTLRREIVFAFTEVKELRISGVQKISQQSIVDDLSKEIPKRISEWLDRRVQSQRPDRPDGLFDLIPSPEQLKELVDKLASVMEFQTIIDVLTDWLRSRIESQLDVARDCFRQEVQGMLKVEITAKRDEIIAKHIYRESDVTSVFSALETGLLRRATELIEWFRTSADEQRKPLTFGEIKQAADGLFERPISKKMFNADLSDCNQAQREISPDKVRLCFDLISEVFANAYKHNEGDVVRVRVWPFSHQGLSGFVFSNLTATAALPQDNRIQGKRYESQSDALFREGNSGMAKIAALTATLVDCDTELVCYRRRSAFHLVVPIWSEDQTHV